MCHIANHSNVVSVARSVFIFSSFKLVGFINIRLLPSSSYCCSFHLIDFELDWSLWSCYMYVVRDRPDSLTRSSLVNAFWFKRFEIIPKSDVESHMGLRIGHGSIISTQYPGMELPVGWTLRKVTTHSLFTQ